MPIQETLTGITFPAPTLNVNTIPTPVSYFGSQCELWLEANAGVTNDGSGNAAAWADLSSYGRNLGEVSGVLPPPIVASAQNGLPGLQSTNPTGNICPFLRSAYSVALDFLATTPFSVVMVIKPVATSFTVDGEIGNIVYTNSNCPGWVAGLNGLKPTLRLINSRTVAECSVSTSLPLPANTTAIVEFVNMGTGTAAGIKIYVNGVPQATTVLYDNLAGASTQTSTNGVAAPATGTGGALGGSRSTLLEAIVVAKAMTAQDVAVMDGYLNAKYAIH